MYMCGYVVEWWHMKAQVKAVYMSVCGWCMLSISVCTRMCIRYEKCGTSGIVHIHTLFTAPVDSRLCVRVHVCAWKLKKFATLNASQSIGWCDNIE